MILHETRDLSLVKSVITDPGVWPFVSDDDSPAIGKYWPSETVTYVIVKTNDDRLVLGLFALAPISKVMVEVHTCLLPEVSGKDKLKAALLLIKWVWENTEFHRLITCVPAYNRAALWFSKKVGLIEYGLNRKSIMKNGALQDTHLLGISREASCQ